MESKRPRITRKNITKNLPLNADVLESKILTPSSGVDVLIKYLDINVIGRSFSEAYKLFRNEFKEKVPLDLIIKNIDSIGSKLNKLSKSIEDLDIDEPERKFFHREISHFSKELDLLKEKIQ